MASIRKEVTKTGRVSYRVQVYKGVNPKTGKKSYAVRRGFDSYKKATIAAAKLELAVSEGSLDVGKPQARTFQSVYVDWYESYVNTVQESTWARTAGMFDNHILPIFGSMFIDKIERKDAQDAINKWHEKTTANYRRWYNYTVSVLDYALENGLLDRNPIKGIKLPKKERKPGDELPNFWTREELAQFFAKINKKADFNIFVMFRVLAYSACRRGELLALEWVDVNFKDNTIRINKTLTQGKKGKQKIQAPKTAAGKRTVPIDAETMAYLKQWRHEQQMQMLRRGYNTLQPHQLVFANTKNGYHCLNTPGKRLKKIIDDNKLPHKITVHGFRHSAISNMLIAGVPITAVQHIVGHSDPTVILKIYAHVTEKEEREATNALAEYYASSQAKNTI